MIAPEPYGSVLTCDGMLTYPHRSRGVGVTDGVTILIGPCRRKQRCDR